MGLIFNGNGDVIKAVDGSLTVEGLDIGGSTNIEAGIGTFSGNLNVGGVLTYEDVKNVDSVGIVTARAGVRVTGGDILLTGGDGRKISFANDGSSHYFKMDNSFNGPVINGYGGIKFETNGTNERLRITSAGKIGIGTDSPQEELTIRSSTPALMLRDTDQEGSYTQVSNANQDMYFSANGTSAHANFIFRSGNAGSFLERLRISSGGGVYIGNTGNSFNSVLGVHKAASNAQSFIVITNNTTGTTTNDGFIVGLNGSQEALLFNKESTPMRFATAGSERLRITSAGKVGIGTDDPAKTLDVYGSFQVKDSGGAIRLLVHEDSGQFEVNQSVPTWTNTTHDPSPLIKWGWKSSCGNYTFMASGGNAAVGSQMSHIISENHGFKVGRSGYDGSDGDVSSTAEYFRITNEGKVGIGTNNIRTTSAATLEIGGVGGTPTAHLTLRRMNTVGNGNDLGIICFAGDGPSAVNGNRYGAQIYAAGAGTWTGSSYPAHLIFRTTSASATTPTERLRITSAGKIGINQTTWTDKDHMFEVAQSTNDKEIARFTNLGGVSGSVQGKGFIGLSVFNGTTYPHVSIGVEEAGTGNYQGHLTFATRNASNDSAPTERLRIDSSGNMCLGGTPFSQGTGNTFCIHSSGTGGGDHAYIYFTNGDSGHSESNGMSIGLAANQVANISVREAWPLAISTNGSERLRIDSSGRVLIGNASNTGVAGNGVRIQSDAVGSNYATGALALRGTGGDFYAITMLGDSGNAWGMLPIFSSTPDRLSFGYYASSGSSNTSIFTIYADGKALINSGYLQAQDLQIGLAGDRYPIIQRAVASSGSQSLSITGGSGYSTNTASAHTPTDAKQGALIVLKAGNPTSDTFGGGIQYYANGHTSPNNPGSGNQHVFYTRSGANTYAERIRIEEGGRILINTPGTSINAHEQCDDVVIGNVSHGHDTGVTIVSGTSYNGWIAFSDGTTNSTRRRGAIVYHHPSDTMYLRTNNNQTALQISSDGEVTKPRNPAFSVRHSVNQSVTSSGWTQKTFNTEIFDIGGNFASNAFTAPVDGIYSFGWNQRFDSGNGSYFRIALRVNDGTGSQYQHGHSIYRDDDGFHYVTLNLTSLLQLDAGDVVKAYVHSNTDTSYTLQNESIFWGYLVS